MANFDTRITALEQRRAPAGECPELFILHGDEELTPYQQSELERAARGNLPTLTIHVGRGHHA